MKLREFLKQDIDIDIEGTLTDDWLIAFVGPLELTAAGEREFGEILDNEVRITSGSHAVLEIENDEQDEKAADLFTSAAGYCSEERFDVLFIE